MKRWVASQALFFVIGCSDPGAEAPSDTAPPPTPVYIAPALIGTASVRLPDSRQDTAVAGVEVCALADEGEVCAWSDDDGAYVLGPLAADRRYRVRYSKPGLVPLVTDYDVPGHSIAADVFLFAADTFTETARALGTVVDFEGSAGILLSAHTVTYDGIVPLEGVRAAALSGDATFTYAGIGNDLDAAQPATTPAGWALALDVAPGSHRLVIAHDDPGAGCGRYATHAGALQNPAAFEAVPGALTLAKVFCFR